MISVLDFFNRVRTLCDLPELPCVWLLGCEADDETACVVASALGAPVGASEHREWGDERWVMRLPDPTTARVVGIVTELAWRAHPAEVALPDEVVDLAASHHFDAVEEGEAGELSAWWVLDRDDGEWEHFTPTQPIIESTCGVLPRAA